MGNGIVNDKYRVTDVILAANNLRTIRVRVRKCYYCARVTGAFSEVKYDRCSTGKL